MSAAEGPYAIVLAAGNGQRLAGMAPPPKPLVPVGGRTLLDHVLGGLSACGIERAAIVVGCHAAAVRGAHYPSWSGRPLAWIENPDYDRPNGLSLLASEGWASGPFVLLMADHLFHPRTLQALLGEPCPDDGGILVVDSRVAEVFDPDDATRVTTRAGLVERVGKGLDPYDAIDTGMFLLSAAAFGAMRASAAAGDESLSGGINRLAAAGRLRALSIGAARWIDVDTPEARVEAERLVAARMVGLDPDRMPPAVGG